MQKMRRILAAGGLGLVLLSLGHLGVQAQGFSYTTTTQVKLTGATGDVTGTLAALAGGIDQISRTVLFRDDKLRIEQGTGATILDLENRRLVTLKDDRCTLVSFEQPYRPLSEGGPPTDAADPPEAVEYDQVSYDASKATLDFSIEPTGPVEVGGYLAETYTMTIIAAVPEEGGGAFGLEGTIVLVSDLVMVQGIEGYDRVLAFQQRWTEEVGDLSLGEEGTSQVQNAIAQDPRIQRVIEIALEETIELDGMPLKKTDYVVWVPSNVGYDPGRVRPKKETNKKKVGRLLRKALGKKKEVPDASGQQTLFYITTTVDAFGNRPLAPALFEPSPTCEAQ